MGGEQPDDKWGCQFIDRHNGTGGRRGVSDIEFEL